MAPKYITSGQTIAACADTGKLFKDEYKTERKKGDLNTQIKIGKPPNNRYKLWFEYFIIVVVLVVSCIGYIYIL